jgi:superfamily II DNA/RNA helicase
MFNFSKNFKFESSARSKQNINKSRSNLEIPDFTTYDLHSDIFSFLGDYQITSPSPVQQLVLSSYIHPKNTKPKTKTTDKIDMKESSTTFIGGPTGSGKTFAFLLPLFDCIKKQEEEKKTIFRLPNRPQAIILAPSKELINQIYEETKKISYSVKLKIGKTANDFREDRYKQELVKEDEIFG